MCLFICLCIFLVFILQQFSSSNILPTGYKYVKYVSNLFITLSLRWKIAHKSTNYVGHDDSFYFDVFFPPLLQHLNLLCHVSTDCSLQSEWLDNWQHLAECCHSSHTHSHTHRGPRAAFNTVHHRKQILSFNMLEAKHAPLLLLVSTLLMVSCGGSEHAAERGTYTIICLSLRPMCVCCLKSTMFVSALFLQVQQVAEMLELASCKHLETPLTPPIWLILLMELLQMQLLCCCMEALLFL